MKNAAIVLLIALLVGACKMENAEQYVIYGPASREALEAFGFTNVTINGPAFYGCGKDYSIATEFSATGPRGHLVDGVVCGGLLVKGWSVKIWRVRQAGANT